MRSNFNKQRCAVIGSDVPADEWLKRAHRSHGNRKKVANERISLNHDLLWRRYITWQDKKCNDLLPEIRNLCRQGLWMKHKSCFFPKSRKQVMLCILIHLFLSAITDMLEASCQSTYDGHMWRKTDWLFIFLASSTVGAIQTSCKETNPKYRIIGQLSTALKLYKVNLAKSLL